MWLWWWNSAYLTPCCTAMSIWYFSLQHPPTLLPQFFWDIALARLVTSSWRHTSTTSCYHWVGVALWQCAFISPKPKALPIWTWPPISLCQRGAFASSVALAGVCLSLWSWLEQLYYEWVLRLCVISNLVLVHLYSSTRLEIISDRIPLP